MGALRQLHRKYSGVRGLFDFMSLVRDPQDTTRIFALNRHLKDSKQPEWLEKMLASVYADPDMNKAFTLHYWPRLPEFEEMQNLPEGSFGREYATFVIRNNLDKDLFPAPVFSDKTDYLTSRIYQAHDFWHVLTGYTTAIEDELALQAFGVAQYHQPLSALIVSGGLLHILRENPENAELALEKISEGFTRGRRAKNLLTSNVLEKLGEPLIEVRAELNL